VISLGVYQIGDFIRKGALMDFMDYIDKDKDFKKLKKDIFPASLLDLIAVDGGVYGIPAWQNPDVLYYNKNLFDEAGVSYPDETWDYERFVEECLKLTKTTNGKITQFGTWGLNWYWNYLWAYGADVLNEDGTRCLLDTPESIEAFEYMINLSKKHHVAPRPAERSQQTDYQAFMTGKVATFTSGRYMIPMLKDTKDFQWDVAVLPHGKNRETVNNVVYWLGLKSSKNPDATWEYIKFLASEEVQKIIVSYDNDVPILRPVMESNLFINPEKPPKSDHVFIDALANSRPFPMTMDVWIDGAVNEALESTVLGNKTVKEAFITTT
jgi:multiple sugar transport system substrate-binding protein